MNDLILRQDQDGVATLTLNRPDRLNALSKEVFEALDEHVESIRRMTKTVGVVVLRGAGGNFSAGYDMNEVLEYVKADAKQRRAKDRERRENEYKAMRSGDERNMPLEHRGPEKRFIRDYIDARTSVGEFLLPMSILFVVLSLVVGNQAALGGILILGFYVIVLMAAVETWLMLRRLKKAVIAKFGANKLPRGFTFYCIARSLNMRRFRTPKPKVRRGEFPA